MKNKIAAALKALKGNSGSGIVLVLVCMLCVSMLGIMILYLSYTGLLIKVTERQSQENFYDATTAMDEVRAGVQKAASDSIAEAYKTMLSHYSDATYAANMKAKFQEEFTNEFYAWKTDVKIGQSSLPVSTALISSTNTYNTDVLSSFLTSAHAVLSGTGGNAVVRDAAAGTITLKGITVTYTDPKKGYSTTVTSDISVVMPDFSYVISNYSVSGLPSYALIAQNAISCSGINDTTVKGSAYGGTITTPATFAKRLIFSGGTVICGGGVTAAGSSPSGSITADNTASLWANRLNVGNSSSLLLQGSSYVQDDLELAGRSKAELAGNYYGFGSSADDATKSSAIIVNGAGTTLDLSNAKRLMLAGHSFVWNNGTDTGKTDVMMGESVSVRENQMVYLVPKEYLTGAGDNPLIYTGTEPTVTLSSKVLWDGKTFADYGAALYPVHNVYPGASDQKIVYYFVKFDSAAHANDYFKSYFAHNTAKINSYVSNYTTLTSSAGTVQAAGWTLNSATDKNNKTTYSLGTAPDMTLGTSAAQIKSTYSQLSTTLFVGGGSAAADMNPYKYIVDTAKVNAITGTLTFSKDDAVVGVITKGNYTVSSAPEKVCVIIATGDVTVDRDFSGLIIAGGSIDLEASVSASDSVSSAFGALNGDTTLGSYFSHGAGSANAAGSGANSGWNFDELVTYQNWKKY